MKRWAVAAIMVCGLLLIQVSVRAESKETDPLRFSVQASADYTDNRDSVKTGKESNTDFYIKPRMEGNFDWQNTTLMLSVAPIYRYRTEPSQLQNDSELQGELVGNLRHRLSPRHAVRLLEFFNYTDDPSIEAGAIRRQSDSYYLNRVEAGTTYAFSRQAVGDLYGRYQVKRYTEDAVAADADEDIADVGGTWRQQLNPDLGLDLMAVLTDFGYNNIHGLDRDFTSTFAGAALDKKMNPNLSAGVKAGLQFVSYADSGLDNKIAPFGELWVKGSTVPTARLGVSVGHGVRGADAFPFASQEYTELRGNVEFDATPKIMLSATAMYRLSDYSDVPASARYYGAVTTGDETTTVGSAGVTYRLSDSSSIVLAHRIENVESDVRTSLTTEPSFTKNTTSLAVTKQF